MSHNISFMTWWGEMGGGRDIQINSKLETRNSNNDSSFRIVCFKLPHCVLCPDFGLSEPNP